MKVFQWKHFLVIITLQLKYSFSQTWKHVYLHAATRKASSRNKKTQAPKTLRSLGGILLITRKLCRIRCVWQIVATGLKSRVPYSPNNTPSFNIQYGNSTTFLVPSSLLLSEDISPNPGPGMRREESGNKGFARNSTSLLHEDHIF